MAKTYTTVSDKSAGDTFTEAMWDDQIKTNINNLITPARVYALRTAAQAGVVTATPTAIAFNGTDAFDTDAMHDPASNNTRITFNTAGCYVIEGAAVFAAGATGYRDLNIRKNGTTILKTVRAVPIAAVDFYMEIHLIQQFDAADYIELVVHHTQGADLAIQADGAGNHPHLAAAWLGAL